MARYNGFQPVRTSFGEQGCTWKSWNNVSPHRSIPAHLSYDLSDSQVASVGRPCGHLSLCSQREESGWFLKGTEWHCHMCLSENVLRDWLSFPQGLSGLFLPFSHPSAHWQYALSRGQLAKCLHFATEGDAWIPKSPLPQLFFLLLEYEPLPT